MEFLSIQVVHFDEKKWQINTTIWRTKSKYYPNPMLAYIGKEKDSDFIRQLISFQILICLSEVFVSFVREYIFLVQLEINKQDTPIW